MSNLAEFRINIGDLTEPELTDASKPAVDPSSLGFDIQKNQNDALLSNLAGVNPLSGALAQQNASDAEKKERDKKASSDTFMLLVLLDRINALETDLAAKYGENFAEDLFADLHQQGLIEQEDYDRIMAIKDQDERRQAIAVNIQQGLEKGTITDSDLEENPWDVHEWLGPRVEREAEVRRDSRPVLEGKVDVNTVENNVKSTVEDTLTAFNAAASPENIALTNEDHPCGAQPFWPQRTQRAAPLDHPTPDQCRSCLYRL